MTTWVEAIVSVVVLLAGLFIGPQKWASFHTGKFNNLLSIVRIAVDAAEKQGNANDLTSGDKYEYAAHSVAALARKAGMRVPSDDVINALIHSVLHGVDKDEQDRLAYALAMTPVQGAESDDE